VRYRNCRFEAVGGRRSAVGGRQEEAYLIILKKAVCPGLCPLEILKKKYIFGKFYAEYLDY
jgi:hypothetical protein